MKQLTVQQCLEEVERTLAALHEQQAAKAQKVAQRIRPDLTSEDLLNPDNFPEVVGNAEFMYEDGLAAGILAAKIALRARLKEL